MDDRLIAFLARKGLLYEKVRTKWYDVDISYIVMINVAYIVTEAKVDGKCTIIAEDRAKTKSSLRSLPLVANFREKLLALKEQQKENRRICENCYNTEYSHYVFVDLMGNIIKPSYITSVFGDILEKNEMRHIRFHDLRHSCASLLLANDISMKQIQEWLGHSDISTTANIYSHLDFQSKINSANVMNGIFTLRNLKRIPGGKLTDCSCRKSCQPLCI